MPQPSSGSNIPQDLMQLIHEAGFTGQAADTMYAIVMAESGGNADAHNTNATTGDNSYGLAQINMLGSMGPERLREYGLSSNDALFDPLTNLKVAYKMSGGGTHFDDWSTFKSGAYQQYLGQVGGVVTFSPGNNSGGSLTAPSATPLTSADYKSALGDWAQLLGHIPDLQKVMSEAVAKGWTKDEFLNKWHQTAWWMNNSQQAKQLILNQYANPADYKQQINNATLKVQQLAGQEGIKLDPTQLASFAKQYIINGWTDTTLSDQLGKQFNPNSVMGQAAQYEQQLKQLFSSYGVPISQASVNQWTKEMLMGTTTLDTFTQDAMQWAKSLYPSIAPQIDAGMTTKSIADPYMQQMGNLLEIDPANITLQDPMIKKALQGTTTVSNGSATHVATPLWQFENQVRSDPRWQFTTNARDQISSTLTQVGKDFGFIGG